MKAIKRIVLAAALLCASPGPTVVQALGEAYPWPNACMPSCEKPMRREFSEPLEFGARVEPEKRTYTPRSTPRVKTYSKSAKKKPPVVVQKRRPRGPRAPVVVIAPVQRPVIVGPIRPHRPPVIYVPTQPRAPSLELSYYESMLARALLLVTLVLFVGGALLLWRRR